MIREEAIEILEEEAEYLYQDDRPYNREAFDMAIEALSKVDTTENPNPMSHEEAWKQIEGDIISRAEAIRAIQDGYCACVSDCIDEINKLPNMGTDCTDFINWIRRVVADEELWELNAVGYGEIICRKLVKIGALATTEKPPYYYVPSAELAELKQKFESAEAVQGEWIWRTDISIGDGRTSAGYICSNCGKDYWHGNVFDFCPNCGAKMKGGEE